MLTSKEVCQGGNAARNNLGTSCGPPSANLARVVFAQGGHTIQGKVIGPSGNAPTQPVRVSLTLAGRPIYETFTDLSGRFSFSGVASGTYELTADGDDATFETTTVSIEVSAFGSAPQLFTQSIQLRPLRTKPTARASVLNSFSQTVPKEAQQKFEQATNLSAAGKTDDAIKLLADAIKIFPDYFDAHLMLGRLFVNANSFAEATTELDRAREINPKDDRTYQSFGLMAMRQRSFALAVAVFAEAAREVFGDDHLIERAGAAVGLALAGDDAAHDFRHGDDIAEAQRRRQGLRE